MKRIKKPSLLARALGNRRWQFLTIPLFAVLASLVASAVIVLLVGKNPLQAFSSLLQGAGWIAKGKYATFRGMPTDFMEMLDAFTPMLFAALGVAVAFRAGLFNIGISGQMLMGGFVATVVVGYSGLPALVARPLVLLIGLAVGALCGGLIGLLKYRFNINEVVSSIMLNYIFQYVISFFINTKYVDPVSRQSRNINPAARLTLIDVAAGIYKIRVPLCIILAVGCAVLLHFYLTKTRQGYELTAVGKNRMAANYAGIRVGRTMVSAMTLSGALAGLAGVTYYMGHLNSIQPGVLASMGFDSIAVAMLGGSHPIGILFSSLLITTLSRGSTYMSSTVGVRQEIASLITGMILLFSACGNYIRYRAELGLRTGGKEDER